MSSVVAPKRTVDRLGSSELDDAVAVAILPHIRRTSMIGTFRRSPLVAGGDVKLLSDEPSRRRRFGVVWVESRGQRRGPKPLTLRGNDHGHFADADEFSFGLAVADDVDDGVPVGHHRVASHGLVSVHAAASLRIAEPLARVRLARKQLMKGPGLRIDIDVRRAWLCPTCGKGQRLAMDIAAPRCPCVRDGVPMKLAEGLRSGPKALRTELRSMVDRIQAGEEFARLTSPITSEGEGASRDGGYGGARSRNRPPRQDRPDDRNESRPPREPQPDAPPELRLEVPVAETPPTIEPPPQLAASTPPPPPTSVPDDDDFGAGISVG